MKKFEVACWEIEKYEIHFYFHDCEFRTPEYFDTEEEAVNFIRKYYVEHPNYTLCLKKTLRACFY